ncbi:isoprenylcysteine carboxylmethyltransferase family protein [Microvirga sp. ACRRW]|uniref:methyltransferase family protein n=1 Tax=Microvirga sp. ACRRW TaxID=2918205 RepID=UPI001EF618B1|nr:isoprenylcysteine carboxylmethyltransferase family protein [Microvirga sp. ACRRW]MCG7392911.1 isoprenylcysteine carboxylmethyltransferase family protein [Microvirga sp. ACRRW]
MPPAILPILLLVALGIAFMMLTRRVARRIGRSPDHFGTTDSAHDFVGRVYRIGGAGLFVFLLMRSIVPNVDAAAGLISILSRPAVAWSGFMVMVMGSAVIVVAQVQMGASWRIGLDQDRTGLVTTGLFAWSRNPTFLGMMAVVLGAFLMVPTTVTSAVLAACWVAFSVQIRMEEEHLLRMHGSDYDAYRAAAPRWIGRSVKASCVAADADA